MELIKNASAESLKNEIRDERVDSITIQCNLQKLGEIAAQSIAEKHFILEKTVKTPTGANFTGLFPANKRIVVISTKDDYQYFGKGIKDYFQNSVQFYMDFEGKRGIDALSHPIREMNLRDIPDVEAVIIAKSVLATGCTAISLTRRAVEKYDPKFLIIASVFYTDQGVSDVQRALKNAQIYSFGMPDELRDDGMLVPGIGDLDSRLKSDLSKQHSSKFRDFLLRHSICKGSRR